MGLDRVLPACGVVFAAAAALAACSGDDARAPGAVSQGDGAAGVSTMDGDGAAPFVADTGAPGVPARDGAAPASDAPPSDASGLGSGDSVAVDGAADNAQEGGATPCALSSGLLFCDDFEEATTSALPSPWSTSIIGSGTVTVDDMTPAHSGTRSVHVSDADADYDTLLLFHDTAVLPAPAGWFYLRAFVRLGAAMSAGHNSFVLADLASSPGQGNDLRLGEDDQMLMYTVMGDAHGALSNANYYSDGMLPGVQLAPGVWTCLEVLLDSKSPEIDVWVGGAEVPDLHHTDFPVDDYDRLQFGFEKYAGPAMDIWYDDIAIGTERIGCN